MEQQVIPSDYTQYAEAVEIIKHAIERCRYRSAAAVNKETLSLYFGVGKFVSENSRIGCWGTKALPTISKLLQRELPGLHGFSESGLKRMRSFYEEWRIKAPSSLRVPSLRFDKLDEYLLGGKYT